MKLRVLLVALLAGCVTPPPAEDPTPTPPIGAREGPFAAMSDAFADGGSIPEEHTCDGADTSPPLHVEGAPAEATTLAILMYDPDAPVPQAPTRNITHWILWNAPLANGSVAFEPGETPAGSVEGASEGGDPGYMGPCPPQLSPPHRYVFTFFAIEGALELDEGADRATFEQALDGRVVNVTTLTGLYARAIGP